ncbi:MAG TPA: NADH-quinone oxidoreductase subunit N [Candidatus Polarisedimenticolia bacterium]|nr:NADH-quinone oxidoreductase subunit N [Candidatus Polarisedimenticolia bacterium]
MTAFFDPNQIRLISPELVLTISAFLVLGLATLKVPARQLWIPGLTVLACVATLVALLAFPYQLGLKTLQTPPTMTVGFHGMFILDALSIFFKIIFLVSAILTVLLSGRYLDEERAQTGEYYALILFAVVGMMFLASANDFVAIFVALETMALSFYVLVGYLKVNRKSNEAALKYFLLGSFSTGILLYGISLLYGTTGTTSLGRIGIAQAVMALRTGQGPLFLLGVILVTVALGFKIAAVPFHMWVPDAYEGAPTPVTAFLSTGSKAAAFVVLLRVFAVGLGRLGDHWVVLLAILSVASMTLGNVAAILQDNVKRMLAYSSIAHAGYALMGVIVIGLQGSLATREWGEEAVILYLFIYTFVNLGAFALVTLLRREQVVGDRVADFAGLARRAPLPAFAMLVFMLSLAGIPATAGFVGKYYLFGAAVRADYTWLAVVAVLNSAVSLYYYARVVVMMYMREPESEARLAPSLGQRMAIGTCIAFTLFFGIFPEPILAFAHRSILSLAPWVP